MPIVLSAADQLRCEQVLSQCLETGGSIDQLMPFIRSELNGQCAGHVVALLGLQAKAVAKLGAGIWWCTERSLQQATPWQVAQQKSRWMPMGEVFDLCSGIGGDGVWLSRQGDLVAIDCDPTMADMCEANLRLRGVNSTVRCADVLQQDIPTSAAIHIDPDRRPNEKRMTHAAGYLPPIDDVFALVGRQPAALIKVAPAAEIESPIPMLRIWISLALSVREQTLVCGQSIDLAASDLGISMNGETRSAVMPRSAVMLSRDGQSSVYSGVPATRISSVKQPLAFMLDIDPAIRAAGLTECFAGDHGAASLGAPSGFLTSGDPIAHPGVICESVVWSGSCDDRKLRRELRARKAYPRRVKTRGVDHNPNELEKRYRQCGDEPVTLWIGRAGEKRYAVITK
ncbi:class I SAM-dependent methyltransferase [Stieleria varia]|uniref:THUMP-like domain-containing protein n=1 Tax=Stieleria varia TaxID=2528005 RepID=A0A5C6B3F5_9BACT|nr:class I SAM-dependent methyltransferase [Stieleria varia]TWU06062.1 hypothetical protein Pla52n_17820 [Stieleria varia]